MSDRTPSAAQDLLPCECHGNDLVPYCPRHTPLPGDPAACVHEWTYFPTLDTNPEQHFRKCDLCGLRQRREGITYLTDGSALPETEWREGDLDA